MDKHIFSISWYSINKPKYISFNPPRIQRRAIVSKPGCSSIGSIEGVAMVNSCHRQTRQFRFSSLSYYDNAQRLWDRREDLLKSLEEDDMMSETDSDEEPVEEEEPIYPTLALCRNLFEKDDEENAEIENTEEDLAENVKSINDNKDFSSSNVAPASSPVLVVLFCFVDAEQEKEHEQEQDQGQDQDRDNP